MKCSNCGNEFEGKFCSECGAPSKLNQPDLDPSAPQQQSLMQFGGQNTNSDKVKKKIPKWGIFAIVIGIIFLISLTGSKVGTALGISGTIGMLMFAVSLIVSIIKKQRKKTDLIGLFICIAFAIIAANALPNGSNVPVPTSGSVSSNISGGNSKDVSLTSEEQEAYNKIKEKVDSEIAESDGKVPITIDYKTLHKEYMDNPIGADEKYKGKKLILTGKIDSIDREIAGNPYVTFSISTFENIRITFNKAEESKVAKFKKGQTIKIIGECRGTLISTTVSMDNCLIVE